MKPHEIYNLAAQSHVKVSFEMSEYTSDVDGLGTLRILNAIRTCGLEKTTRFYQASTSELYGKVQEVPQTETTPFYPRSPYACAKQFTSTRHAQHEATRVAALAPPAAATSLTRHAKNEAALRARQTPPAAAGARKTAALGSTTRACTP